MSFYNTCWNYYKFDKSHAANLYLSPQVSNVWLSSIYSFKSWECNKADILFECSIFLIFLFTTVFKSNYTKVYEFFIWSSYNKLNHRVSSPAPSAIICTSSPKLWSHLPDWIIVSTSFLTMWTLAQYPRCIMMSRLPLYLANSSAKLSLMYPLRMADILEARASSFVS